MQRYLPANITDYSSVVHFKLSSIKIIIIVSIFFEFAFPNPSGNQATISGQVRDGDFANCTLPGVQLIALDAKNHLDTLGTTTSNSLGNFSLPVIITGITDEQNALPEEYGLSNAYPNPTNPLTNIVLSMPKSGDVQIAEYNVLGKELSKKEFKDLQAARTGLQ